MRQASLSSLLVVLVSVSSAAHAAEDASTTEAGAACTHLTTEATCLAVDGCAWGDQGAGPVCFAVGNVEAQPGTGDPGGGGGPGSIAGIEGGSEGGGCSLSGRIPTGGATFGLGALVLAASRLRRRRERTTARVETTEPR